MKIWSSLIFELVELRELCDLDGNREEMHYSSRPVRLH